MGVYFTLKVGEFLYSQKGTERECVRATRPVSECYEERVKGKREKDRTMNRETANSLEKMVYPA